MVDKKRQAALFSGTKVAEKPKQFHILYHNFLTGNLGIYHFTRAVRHRVEVSPPFFFVFFFFSGRSCSARALCEC